MRHLAFAVKLCLAQYKAAMYFAFEHPQNAKSWKTRVMGLSLRLPGVRLVEFDFCMAGMEGQDELGKAPVRKTTKILTNSEHLANALSELRCSGEHCHVHFVRGRTRAAQEYPELFCRIVWWMQTGVSDMEGSEKCRRSTVPSSWRLFWRRASRLRQAHSSRTRIVIVATEMLRNIKMKRWNRGQSSVICVFTIFNKIHNSNDNNKKMSLFIVFKIHCEPHVFRIATAADWGRRRLTDKRSSHKQRGV